MSGGVHVLRQRAVELEPSAEDVFGYGDGVSQVMDGCCPAAGSPGVH